MSSEVKHRISPEELRTNPALQKVSRWRLPDSGGDYSPKDNVQFARDHSDSFFKLADEAIGHKDAS